MPLVWHNTRCPGISLDCSCNTRARESSPRDREKKESSAESFEKQIEASAYPTGIFIGIFSVTQSNWTSCPLGRKSIEIKGNSTSLLNYYSSEDTAKRLPLQFELPQITDVRSHSHPLQISLCPAQDSIAVNIFVFYHHTSTLLNQFHTTFRRDISDGVFQQSTLIDMTTNGSNINQYVPRRC